MKIPDMKRDFMIFCRELVNSVNIRNYFVLQSKMQNKKKATV